MLPINRRAQFVGLTIFRIWATQKPAIAANHFCLSISGKRAEGGVHSNQGIVSLGRVADDRCNRAKTNRIQHGMTIGVAAF